MRMFVAALVGGAVLGFLEAKFFGGTIEGMLKDPEMQKIAGPVLAAFLGVIWGWLAKGLIGSRGKD